MTTGIYKIENKVNGKVYIGKSEKDIIERWDSHLYYLRRGNHSNSHLQHSYNKYGEHSFDFSILYSCPAEDCNVAEKVAIACFQSENPLKGYNKTEGGDGRTISKYRPYVLNRVGWNNGKQQYGVRRAGVILKRSVDLGKLRSWFKKEYPYETLDLSVLLKEE